MLTELRQELARSAKTLKDGPIFIVEDDTDDQLFLWREVKMHFIDAEVKTFKNGKELLTHLEKGEGEGEKPSLILLDLNMPKMGGLETLDKLNKSPASSDIPVVVLSNTRSGEQIEAVKERGAQAFLSKPFSKDQWVFFDRK